MTDRDFNAHHTSWGCGSDSIRDCHVLDVIEDNNLVLLNNGQATTVASLTWSPNALVSSSLALSCEWGLHDSPLGYHIPVIIRVNVSVKPLPASNAGYCFTEENKIL
ncbi:unnamed protein product [Pieris macdunnoughi]|uniref:Endonuclease/exonuclease/phosphatase domain-containing protein n=1 Tax=Pieris macdunnoughi TaxID=345717 RepID=A0A821UIC7_9NEOP|nr:unnamed protein product [Pieris macdunnoughi]